VSLPDFGLASAIKDPGGVRWRRDGGELLHFSLDNQLMAVDVVGGAAFRTGIPKPLFSAPTGLRSRAMATGYRWDVSADGRKFLMSASAGESSRQPLVVVLNWMEMLKK
jgi:hypothetical protein